MTSGTDSLVSRRRLLRLGVFAGLASALRPLAAEGAAAAVTCNAQRPATAAGALEALLAGNARWASLKPRHPGEDQARRTCVAENGQTPFAAIIACSDSRVAPELVFDQGMGDLFVARVAGNGASGTLAEGLYYGTDHLGAMLLFVLGHSDCGAVKAAVNSYPRHELQFVNLIFPAVERARKIVQQNGGNPDDPKQVIPVATDQNVILEVEGLRKSKPFEKAYQDGTLLIAGGRYDLATQKVTVLIK